MNQRHKWADEIIAWANGAKIQFRAPRARNGEWTSSVNPEWREDFEYRVAPDETQFRNYVQQDPFGRTHVYTHMKTDITNPANLPGFVRWIGDWQSM